MAATERRWFSIEGDETGLFCMGEAPDGEKGGEATR